MEYYRCPVGELCQETQRRGLNLTGSCDQLSESLQKDDDARESDATTITTETSGYIVQQEVNLARTAEFGETAPVDSIVGESAYQVGTPQEAANPYSEIIYWAMNTFFPSLQLFFESGRSCTIQGGRLPGARMGLDPKLRFRMTDSTHEEDGRITKSTLPAKFARAGTGLVIREASIAQRTSIAVEPRRSHVGALPSFSGCSMATITHGVHVVVGLRLAGMSSMGYVWAKEELYDGGHRMTVWGDARFAGCRTDVPAPIIGYPEYTIKPGGHVKVVSKGSLIHWKTMEERIGRILSS